MSKELTPLEIINIKLKDKNNKYDRRVVNCSDEYLYLIKEEELNVIETALKDYEDLKEENILLRENNENLDENYFDTWSACERLKENSDYALMFVDDIYCLVDTKDNKFDVVDEYKINNYGIIDNGTQKKLKAFEIIKEKEVAVFFLNKSKDVNDYNHTLKTYGTNQELTQEEYDLLKEILK